MKRIISVLLAALTLLLMAACGQQASWFSDEESTRHERTVASGNVMLTESASITIFTSEASMPIFTTPLYSIQKTLSFFHQRTPSAFSSLYFATL